jgi:ATP-binding cassette subfamily C protein
MLSAIIMGTIGYLCATAITILGGMAIVNILGYNMPFTINTLCILLILCAFIRAILRYIEQACNHYIAFKILAIIRDKVFKALRILSPAKLEGKDRGNLISIITSDIELLEVFYAHTISPIVIGVLTSLIMTLYIGSFHPLLGIVAIIAYIFVGAIIPIINSKVVKSSGIEYRNEVGKMNSLMLDSLRGLRELIQYNEINDRYSQLQDNMAKLSSSQNKLKKAESNSFAITDFTIIFFTISMLFASFFLYSYGEIDFSRLVLATIAMSSSFGPVVALSSLSNNLAHTLASGERVLTLLEEEPIVEEKIDGTDFIFDNLTCKNVNFSYDNTLILDNISLSVNKGNIIGILGKSGCGKSTLLKLIMRFWDKDSGEILFGNEDIKNINTRSLRQNESYATQDTHLFNDTIGNNIKIANASASYEEVIEAAKKASIHDFISNLPKGYDTPIGELGDRLSGGEKQRIGIARTFLSPSSLMLLDEPTSNLDSLNEGIIIKSLLEAREDRTIILVSHRKSTLGIAEKIYSIEKGRLS